MSGISSSSHSHSSYTTHSHSTEPEADRLDAFTSTTRLISPQPDLARLSLSDGVDAPRARTPSPTGSARTPTSHGPTLSGLREQVSELPSFRLASSVTGITHREEFPERQQRREQLGLPRFVKPEDPVIGRRLSVHEFRTQVAVANQAKKTIPFTFGRARLSSDPTNAQKDDRFRDPKSPREYVTMGGRPIPMTESQRRFFAPFSKATEWTKETVEAVKKIAVKHGRRATQGDWARIRGDQGEALETQSTRDVMGIFSHSATQMSLYEDNHGQPALRVRGPGNGQQPNPMVENTGRGIIYSTERPIHGMNNERTQAERQQANEERAQCLERQQQRETGEDHGQG